MTLELDLREAATEAVRDRIFEALDGATDGEAVDVVADRNVEVELLGYQVERGLDLECDYDEVGPDAWRLSVTRTGSLGDGELPAFDARYLPPRQRHGVLTAAFDELESEEGFVLVNDHDPKPLYHELRSTHGDVVDWRYESEGGGEWRVAIVRTGESEAAAEDVVTRFDVRTIPKAERHPTIHHRYGMLPEGATMELIAPHEPRPLEREFQQRYGEAFDWHVVEQEPGRVRVRVTKERDASGESDADGEAVESSEEAAGHQCGHDRGERGHGERDHGEHAADGAVPDDEVEAADASLEVTRELDVRDRPPAERHEAIFEAYADLERGEGFVLVNDHDPKPLYHQFDAEAGPEFRWTYRARDPGEFRVLIGKAAADEVVEADGGRSSGAGRTSSGERSEPDGGADSPF